MLICHLYHIQLLLVTFCDTIAGIGSVMGPMDALQMFCLQNTQMFVCILNARTSIGCFYMYLSVMDNKYFHVVFTLNQTLNSLKNEHILSNLQKFCCFNKLFSY